MIPNHQHAGALKKFPWIKLHVWAPIPESKKREWYKWCKNPIEFTYKPEMLSPEQLRSHDPAQGALVLFDETNKPPPTLVEEEEKMPVKHQGYLLTWQGSWGQFEDEVMEMVAQGLKGEMLVTAVKATHFYKCLYKDFMTWARPLCAKTGWQHLSGKAEVSLRAKKTEQNVIHLHLAVSHPYKKMKLHDKELWSFQGFKPHIAGNMGRGRCAVRSLNHLHYYCQAPKIGALWAFTNHLRFIDFTVEQSFIFGLWKEYKMYDDVARGEIILARGTGTQRFLNEIKWTQSWRADKVAAANHRFMEWLIPMMPFRRYPEVTEFTGQFLPENMGRSTRFKFLLLLGDSRFGKTRFATSLFGHESTLVLTCQGANIPPMKSFTRVKDKCVVFDEATSNMVVNNKSLFQAGLDTVLLGQSQCGQHQYSVWTYGVPMIVCTNDWGNDVTDTQMLWLEANSIRLHVTEPMWREPDLAIQVD